LSVFPISIPHLLYAIPCPSLDLQRQHARTWSAHSRPIKQSSGAEKLLKQQIIAASLTFLRYPEKPQRSSGGHILKAIAHGVSLL
jgi:hypothetical protein